MDNHPIWRRYDLEQHHIEYDPEIVWTQEKYAYAGIVSILWKDNRVCDYGCTMEDGIALLLNVPQVMESLRDVVPMPLWEERDIPWGIVIDEKNKQFRYWGMVGLHPYHLQLLQQKFPDWQCFREMLGFVGHLHHTGRSPKDMAFGFGIPWNENFQRFGAQALNRSPLLPRPKTSCCTIQEVEWGTWKA